MKPRITISLSETGELQISLNEEGRRSLIRELQRLDLHHEHFHLGVEDLGGLDLSDIPYHPKDQIVQYAKVLFRPDEWDREYYPHVMQRK